MCDERAAIPIGSYQQAFGVTLSLPTVVGVPARWRFCTRS
jgi:hypothetical protein